MRFLLSAILLSVSGLASAATYTIDFESTSFTGSAPVSFNTQGFTFQQSREGIGVVNSGPFPDGNAYFFCPYCQNSGFSMERTDGTLFSLLSFDFGYNEQDPMPLLVTGTFADNSQTSVSFNNVTGLFETLSPGIGWDNLASVSFAIDTTNNYSDLNIPLFDNIVVSAVPVPAAVWLFGSALAGLGWIRRKQTV